MEVRYQGSHDVVWSHKEIVNVLKIWKIHTIKMLNLQSHLNNEGNQDFKEAFIVSKTKLNIKTNGLVFIVYVTDNLE